MRPERPTDRMSPIGGRKRNGPVLLGSVSLLAIVLVTVWLARGRAGGPAATNTLPPPPAVVQVSTPPARPVAPPAAPPPPEVPPPTAAQLAAEARTMFGSEDGALPKAHPAPPNPALVQARLKYNAGQRSQAAKLAAAALAENPSSAPALALIGRIALDAGKYAEALENAERAQALDDTLADSYLVAGAVHQHAGRRAQARTAYQRYLTLEPRGRQASEIRQVLRGL
jgi:hypothetical protein